jgi:hypothetical protein
MNQNKLSADPLSLILGILALLIGVAGCCCYGITAIVPLIMSIIGLVTANKSLREFAENPDVYSPQSRSNVYTAKVINIIAIIMNGIIVVAAVTAIAFYGTMLSSGVFDRWEQGDFEDDDFYDYEMETDTTSVIVEDIYILEEDSTNTDAKY